MDVNGEVLRCTEWKKESSCSRAFHKYFRRTEIRAGVHPGLWIPVEPVARARPTLFLIFHPSCVFLTEAVLLNAIILWFLANLSACVQETGPKRLPERLRRKHGNKKGVCDKNNSGIKGPGRIPLTLRLTGCFTRKNPSDTQPYEESRYYEDFCWTPQNKRNTSQQGYYT